MASRMGCLSGRTIRRADISAADEARFWSHVVVKGSGCWRWRHVSREYGEFSLHDVMHRAHRVSAALAFGEVRSGEVVLHDCDTPACVRPSHLIVGTQKDNVRDCVAKGRHRRGITAQSSEDGR